MRKPFYLKARKGWYLKINQVDGSVKTIRLEAETKSDAYDEWQRLRTSEAEPTVAESPTVLSLITFYLEAMRDQASLGQLAVATVQRRTDHISPFLLSIDPTMTVSELKQHHVTTWLGTKTTWGATTRHDSVAAIRKAFKWATDEGRIEASPLAKMKMTSGPPR